VSYASPPRDSLFDSDDELPDPIALIHSAIPALPERLSSSSSYDIDDLISGLPEDELERLEQPHQTPASANPRLSVKRPVPDEERVSESAKRPRLNGNLQSRTNFAEMVCIPHSDFLYFVTHSSHVLRLRCRHCRLPQSHYPLRSRYSFLTRTSRTTTLLRLSNTSALFFRLAHLPSTQTSPLLALPTIPRRHRVQTRLEQMH
jgi:hypothetical protein